MSLHDLQIVEKEGKVNRKHKMDVKMISKDQNTDAVDHDSNETEQRSEA